MRVPGKLLQPWPGTTRPVFRERMPGRTRRGCVLGRDCLSWRCSSLWCFVCAWLSDDAYISFRTADNLVHGYGLTWNVQERVQAYTNPLWMLLFAGVYWLTHEAFYTAIFLSIAVSVAAVAWFAWKIAKTRSAAVLGVLVLTVSMAFVDYSTSGLENPLTHLLLVLFLWLYLTRETIAEETIAEGDLPPARNAPAKTDGAGSRGLPFDALPGVLSMLAALSAVNRMDSLLLFMPALLYVLWRRRTWRCLGWMAAGTLPLLLWLGFSLVYYGFPFPNTAYAKLNNGIAGRALAEQGCYYLWNSLKFDPLTLTTIVFALGVACWRRRWRELAVALGIFLYLLYIVKIGGDFMSGRYLTTPLLAAVCLLGTLSWSAKNAWAPAAALIVTMAIVSFRPLPLRSAFLDLGKLWPQIVAEHGICDEGTYYYRGSGLLQALGEPGTPRPKFEWVTEGNTLRTLSAARHEKTIVTEHSTGFKGYYAGPEVYILDNLALSDPLLARLPPVPDPFWASAISRALDSGWVSGHAANRQERPPRSGHRGILRPSPADYARRSVGSAALGGDLEHESRSLRKSVAARPSGHSLDAARLRFGFRPVRSRRLKSLIAGLQCIPTTRPATDVARCSLCCRRSLTRRSQTSAESLSWSPTMDSPIAAAVCSTRSSTCWTKRSPTTVTPSI